MRNSEALILLMLLISFAVPICMIINLSQKLNQLKRYADIKIGMHEQEMIRIMGSGFNKNVLKNNRVKYEWRINSSNSRYSYKGIKVRSYSKVRKVSIYCKNGLVEEIRPYNI